MRSSVLIGILATFGFCSYTSAEEWFEVRAEDRPVTADGSGVVIAQQVRNFGTPPTNSWRTTIVALAREGARVREGDLLVRFDATNLDDRVRDLTGKLAVANGELAALDQTHARELEDEKVAVASARSRASKADRKAEQPEGLIAGMDYKKLVEEKRVENVLMHRAVRRSELAAALREASALEKRARVAQLESRLATARRELDSFTVRAPTAGLVIIGTDMQGNKFDVGSGSNPGLVIVQVADDSELAVEAQFPEHAAAALREGQAVTIEADAAGGGRLAGAIERVANTVRRQSRDSLAMVRDVTVVLREATPEGFRLGTSVQLSVVLDQLQDALAVPESALSYRGGRPGVVRRNGGWTEVRLGRRSEDMWVVEEGLAEGDEVRL